LELIYILYFDLLVELVIEFFFLVVFFVFDVGRGPVIQVDHREGSSGALLGPEMNRPALGGPGGVLGHQAPWHLLNFFWLPQGQGSLRPTSFSGLRTGSWWP
jgi:hypothetical protein